MKQFKNLISTSLLTSCLVAGTAYAGASSVVNFPPGQASGSFSCTANDTGKNGTVNIDTNNINAQGFCVGGQYVTSPGHIAGFPVNSNTKTQGLNSVYFYVQNPNVLRQGTVTVTLNGKGSITCISGYGSGRTQYAPGGGYCLAAASK